jgi:hypothetical protein
MSFVLKFTLLDIGGFFTTLPSLSGSIFAPPGGPLIAAAVSTTPTPLTLTFASSAVPPAGPSALLVTELATGGDFLRSGVVAALPASPANGTVITVPSVPIAAATIAATAAGFVTPPTAIPQDVVIGVALATGGLFIPMTAAITAVTVTLGSGSFVLAVTGTLTIRQFGFPIAHTFTLTTTLVPAPSGDPANASRVLRMTPTASTLGATGIPAIIPSLLAPSVASAVASLVESGVNGLIRSTATGTLASMGRRLTSTAVICAHRVVVTASGVALQLALTDLFGPAVVAIPGTLAVSIAPAPVAGVAKNYVVTVTNAANGAVVQGASVTLQNFAANGASTSNNQMTDAAGQAKFPGTILHTKKIIIFEPGNGGKPHREVDVLSPTLSVTAAGFNSVDMELL